MHVTLVTLLVFFLAMAVSPAGSGSAANERRVENGLMISVEYTLKNTEGKVLETNKGKEPLRYVHGQNRMIPGLERELTGMKVGAEKHVTVKPEDAYGEVNPDAVQEIPKEQIPPDGLQVGAVLSARSPQGVIVPITIREIKEKTVVVDLNHPMAGKTLVFDVKIVDIQPAPAESSPGKK